MPTETSKTPIFYPHIPEDGRILYYGRDRADFRFLSHFWPSPFTLDEKGWSTVEHYYQSQKSFDPDYRTAIRDALRPGQVKRLAAPPDAPRHISKKSWFRKTKNLPRPDWDDVKLEIMRRGDRAKFDQNPELALLLLATGDAKLIEDSPNEAFWGTGPDGNGLNWAGRVLMEARSALKQH